MFFFFKQKTAYEMRISDWSSDVCSSDLWGVIFPGAPGDLPRHPSQLYEFALEGVVLFVVLWFLFYKTDARRKPGLLVGTFLLGYGLTRFFVEFFREPDIQLGTLSWGLTMGQTLTLPMIAGDRKSTRLNSSHKCAYRMPSSA